MKPLQWVGSALAELRAFPDDARSEAGFQLRMVQMGDEPLDWKPMRSIGLGVAEIRIQRDGQFRVLYVARFPEAVYVLHCFRKKTQRTSRPDLEIAADRYRRMTALRRAKED